MLIEKTFPTKAAALFLGCLLSMPGALAQSKSSDNISIGGYVGSRIDDCIEKRVKAQDVDHLVEPFRHKTEKSRWQSEFWGKWVLGAIASYRYCGDEELLRMISESVDDMIATQDANGYIGNYAPEYQLQQWDVWGRKYTTLGLLSYYDLTGDKKALTAAIRVIDHLMTQVGPGKTDIAATGNYLGMASSSVLEPVVYLYTRTNDKKYLDFANYIAESMSGDGGSKLVEKADVPVGRRFPHHRGQKAYEMMSCYEGLLELSKVTGKQEYADAAIKTVNHIINEEINAAGSGSALEFWYGGKRSQTRPTYHTMETCVTFTWMQLCGRLLKLTGNPLYADQMETCMYNALMASLKGDGTQIAKYSPLEGHRFEGEEQCGMHINCCNANGPRAFALIPNFVYLTNGERLDVNFFVPSKATLGVGKKNVVEVVQQTTYPEGESTEISINPKRSAEFTVALRIPQWSKRNSVVLNGDTLDGEIKPGEYFLITRKWSKGDRVCLSLDMRGRLLELNDAQAIMRGPVLLARDSRFGDGFVDEAVVVSSVDNYVELTPAKSDFAWMAFTAPMVTGTNLEGNRSPKSILLCDFSSAGNTWDTAQRYRAWLPKTLNVIQTEYVPYNQ